MSGSWYIVKEGKFFTSGAKFTDNFNLAYIYQNKKEAEYIANEVGGEVIAQKSRIWIVIRDGMYLSNNEKFVKNLEEAYSFSNKNTAKQYARELNGQAVQVLSK